MSRAMASPYTRQKAYSHLATVARRQGNEKAAADFAQKARQGPSDVPWLDPYLAEAHTLGVGRRQRFEDAEHLEATGQLDESARVLRELVHDQPDERALGALGIVLVKLGDPFGAEQALRHLHEAATHLGVGLPVVAERLVRTVTERAGA